MTNRKLTLKSCAVRGPSGKSAYEVAVAEGYTGTAEEYNAMLASVPEYIEATYGTPEPVSTVGGMTDTKKAYLYVGNEPGYEYGCTYVFVSAEWTKLNTYGAPSDEQVSEAVSSWLSENISQPTEPAIDQSLLVSGAGADAKIVGDALRAYVSDVGADYIRLESLSSTDGGEQYVGFGVKFTQKTRTQIVFALTSLEWTGVQYLAGGRSSTTSNARTIGISASHKIIAGYGNETITLDASIYDLAPHVIDYDRNKIYLDGKLIHEFTAASFTTPSNAMMYCISGTGSNRYYGALKIFRATLWADGTLTSDFVPVINKSTGKGGMLDIYGSAGFKQNPSATDLVPGPYASVVSELEQSMELQRTVARLAAQADGRAYVQQEADRVAELVRSVQTGRSITMIVVSDMHYSVDDIIVRDALADMRDGVRAVAEQVHADLCISLGDLIWRLGTDGDYDKGRAEAIAATKLLSEAFGSLPQIRLVGNHDPNCLGASGYFSPDEMNAFAGIYNDVLLRNEAVPNGGYGYVDLERQKIRLIALNTSSYGESTTLTQGESWYQVGPTQANWLAETLDLSGKADAAQWQIVICSHVVLDSKLQAQKVGKYSQILAAYERGGTWDSYDFTGKNSATLACYINGHAHKFDWRMLLEVNNSGSELGTIGMPTLYAPNALPGREDESRDGVTYAKTRFTAASTAFLVVTLDPDNQLLYAHHYGAGIDVILHYAALELAAETELQTSLSSPTWASQNEAVATVSGGTATPVSAGRAMIWCKSEDNNTIEAWHVHVNQS